MSARRTYWHLGSSGRKPSDYEIASSRLLYDARKGFELPTPVTLGVERERTRGGVVCADWERFDDPRKTTYAAYVAGQRDKEVFVDALLAAESDADLPPGWVDVLDEVLGTLRYPLHGLQMLSAYLGSIAPGGKIVIASLFQSADEMRRIQRLTQRMAQLRAKHPSLGARGRESWQSASHWQPLRELVEQLLVVYGFAETLVVLSALLKPGLDGLLMRDVARLASERGDHTLDKLLHSLDQDCAWHGQWSSELLRMMARESEDNRRRMVAWLELWRPRVEAALLPLLPPLGASEPQQRVALAQRLESRLRDHAAWLEPEADVARQERVAP